ncbi:MAG: pilus assembly protein [Herpetosiphon sp.]|nr:pilus assembly protein [Herpetosiphon sp.]
MNRKHKGQALVEFALTATLLFFIMAATIDFGLAFFAYQGLAGAAQEGATYGSLYPVVNTKAGTAPNNAEIISRVRNEAGTLNATYPNRARFVNLHDLNSNGQTYPKDSAESDMITVSTINNYLNNEVGTGITCSDTIRQKDICDLVVRVRYTYRPFFPMASFFGLREVPLTATRQQTISAR